MPHLPEPDSQVNLTINNNPGVLDSYAKRAWSSDDAYQAGKPSMCEWHKMIRQQFFSQARRICGQRFSYRSTVEIVHQKSGNQHHQPDNLTVRQYEPTEQGITFENDDLVTVKPPVNSLPVDLWRWFTAVGSGKLVNLALVIAMLTAVFGPVFAAGWYFGTAGFSLWNVLLVGTALAGFIILVVILATVIVPVIAAAKFWQAFGRAWIER